MHNYGRTHYFTLLKIYINQTISTPVKYRLPEDIVGKPKSTTVIDIFVTNN